MRFGLWVNEEAKRVQDVGQYGKICLNYVQRVQIKEPHLLEYLAFGLAM